MLRPTRVIRQLYWGILDVFRRTFTNSKSWKPFLADISVDRFDLKSWHPSAIDDVYFHLVIEVGWEGEVGTNLFHTMVASPEAVRARVGINEGSGVLSTRAMIIVSEYDYDDLHREIKEIVESAEREDYFTSASVINRFFQWEFEDFNPE